MLSLSNRILKALELGPATVRQLALMLDRTYDWTHQNVRRLEERGEIECCEEGRGHPIGRLSKLYRISTGLSQDLRDRRSSVSRDACR